MFPSIHTWSGVGYTSSLVFAHLYLSSAIFQVIYLVLQPMDSGNFSLTSAEGSTPLRGGNPQGDSLALLLL